MKKVISMFLSFALVLSLTACGQSEQDKKFDELTRQGSDRKTSDVESTPASNPKDLSANLVLRTWGVTDTIEIWKDYIREFNETYPNVHIEVDGYDGYTVDADAYLSQTTVELMGGEAGDILDLNALPAYRYSSSGVLKELDGFMEIDPDFSGDKYYTNVIDAMRCNGKIYTMPYEFMPLGIRLHRPTADKLQISYGTLEPINVSEVLHLSTQAEMPVLGFPVYNWATFNLLEYSSRIDEDGKTADLDSESFIQYLKDLKAAEYTDNSVPRIGYVHDEGELGSGFAGIVTVMTSNKSVMQSYQILRDSPVITPLMALETDEGDRLFQADSLAITTACKNDEAAFAFIKFMLDCERKLDPECYNYRDMGPVNREVQQKMLSLYLEDDAEAAAFDDWFTTLNKVVFYNRNIELEIKLDEICDQYMKDLLSAEDCAKQMQGIADIYLNE